MTDPATAGRVNAAESLGVRAESCFHKLKRGFRPVRWIAYHLLPTACASDYIESTPPLPKDQESKPFSRHRGSHSGGGEVTDAERIIELEQALRDARHELATRNGYTVTDRPTYSMERLVVAKGHYRRDDTIAAVAKIDKVLDAS